MQDGIQTAGLVLQKPPPSAATEEYNEPLGHQLNMNTARTSFGEDFKQCCLGGLNLVLVMLPNCMMVLLGLRAGNTTAEEKAASAANKCFLFVGHTNYFNRRI